MLRARHRLGQRDNYIMRPSGINESFDCKKLHCKGKEIVRATARYFIRNRNKSFIV